MADTPLLAAAVARNTLNAISYRLTHTKCDQTIQAVLRDPGALVTLQEIAYPLRSVPGTDQD